ncbi:fimbrial protein, partial [Salmonella enterica subsp. enterica serovar Braenderup]
MKKYTLILALIISNTGEPHEQRVVFNADVVGSACHVVVDADSSGNSGRLTFGT